MRAIIHDGLSARSHPVVVQIEDGSVSWRDEDGHRTTIAYDQLRRAGSKMRGIVHRVDLPDWRMVFEAPQPEWLNDLPKLGTLSKRMAVVYSAVIATVFSVAALLWLYGDRLLEGMAPLVPHRITKPVGEAIIGSLNVATCHSAKADAALGRLISKLRPKSGFVEPVGVVILDTPMANALAVPGGRIAIFRGLIDEATSADEVAGVLAHELAHVNFRHPTKALLRQTGLSLLVRSLGGDIGGLVDLTLLLQSTRIAEAAADAGAIELLTAARISPTGVANFFARAQKTADAKPSDSVVNVITSFATTHPGSAARARGFSAAAPPAALAAAMDERDWQALRTICAKAK